jgi:hypothetical protein
MPMVSIFARKRQKIKSLLLETPFHSDEGLQFMIRFLKAKRGLMKW